MTPCDTCGNAYERSFQVTTFDGKSYTFDSLECAVHKLAPLCDNCGQRIIGHGIGDTARYFCCAHCARTHGLESLSSDVWEGYMSAEGPGRICKDEVK